MKKLFAHNLVIVYKDNTADEVCLDISVDNSSKVTKKAMKQCAKQVAEDKGIIEIEDISDGIAYAIPAKEVKKIISVSNSEDVKWGESFIKEEIADRFYALDSITDEAKDIVRHHVSELQKEKDRVLNNKIGFQFPEKNKANENIIEAKDNVDIVANDGEQELVIEIRDEKDIEELSKMGIVLDPAVLEEITHQKESDEKGEKIVKIEPVVAPEETENENIETEEKENTKEKTNKKNKKKKGKKEK